VSDAPQPIYFAGPQELREWFEAHGDSERELIVGYWKKAAGRPTVTSPQTVDEALCFGWIDGVIHGVDDQRWTKRFTPRKPGSIWSNVNVKRVGALTAEGRMTPAGIAAFEARTAERSGVYSFERKEPAVFSAEQERELRANVAAFEDFGQRAPSYRRAVTHWVISAKREETQARRLAKLIEDHAAGRPLKQFTRPG
jgi:uncharacterized protein YdeI (YjbR/CyaY-like superfamily)